MDAIFCSQNSAKNTQDKYPKECAMAIMSRIYKSHGFHTKTALFKMTCLIYESNVSQVYKHTFTSAIESSWNRFTNTSTFMKNQTHTSDDNYSMFSMEQEIIK